jgi:hypothetical protein
MHKLWGKGIRGKMWRYIRNMYATTTRAVRCGHHTSDWIDILFGLFVDDLLKELHATSPGVPLPAARLQSPTVRNQTRHHLLPLPSLPPREKKAA